MTKHQYVAMFKASTRGGNYFRFAYLECGEGLIPQPIVNIQGAEYVYAPDQWHIAKAFSTSQQNVSRWMKNKPTPEPKEGSLNKKEEV